MFANFRHLKMFPSLYSVFKEKRYQKFFKASLRVTIRISQRRPYGSAADESLLFNAIC